MTRRHQRHRHPLKARVTSSWRPCGSSSQSSSLRSSPSSLSWPCCPPNVVRWLQFAACTRESRCTSSRIHQRIQKNSVPLKEVLTPRRRSASRATCDDAARCWHPDTRSAFVSCIDICQDCRKCLEYSCFLDSCTMHFLRAQWPRESRNVVNGAVRGL